MMASKSLAGARYALLHLGAVRLIMAQSDIREIEGAYDIDPADAPQGGVGWIQINRQPYPVYCLSEELELLSFIPEQRQMCVMLAHQGGQFGLLCNHVEMLGVPGVFHLLPECMQLADSPAEALALDDDGIACYVTAQRLAKLIPQETCPLDTPPVDGVFA